MIWLNLNTSLLDSEEFVGSDPVDRATWLCLLRYCAGQENGGVIAAADSWTDRKWQQVVRVTLKEVTRTCPLWTWADGSCTVWSYPIGSEGKVRANRTAGEVTSEAKTAAARTNGAKGGRPKENPTASAGDNPTETQPKTNEQPDQEPMKGKDKVREGKERKGKQRADGLLGSPGSLIPAQQPDLIFRRMLAINALKRRSDGTSWTAKEFAAFQAVGLDAIPAEDFAAQIEPLAEYYGAEPSALREMWRTNDDKADFRRRDLLTLLNNFAGEVDRAREWTKFRAEKIAARAAGRL